MISAKYLWLLFVHFSSPLSPSSFSCLYLVFREHGMWRSLVVRFLEGKLKQQSFPSIGLLLVKLVERTAHTHFTLLGVWFIWKVIFNGA